MTLIHSIFVFATVWGITSAQTFNNQACDHSKVASGYLANASPGKVSSLSECQDLCEASSRCKSLSFYADKHCSFFSGNCADRTSTTGATAVKVGAKTDSTAWQLVSYGKKCDADNGEIYLASSGKQANLAACVDSCAKTTKPCRSVTYFKSSGFCSHFVTHCVKTLHSMGAVSYTIPDGYVAGEVESQNSNQQCNLASEGYLTNSPGIVSHLDFCVDLCAQSSECNSVTLYPDGFCSHFTGKCTQRSSYSGAVAITVKANTRYPFYSLVAYDKECHLGKEEYMPGSSKYVSTLRKCLESCDAVALCKSVTFYHDKFCSHFSSPCNNLDTVKYFTPHPGQAPPMVAASYLKRTTTTTTAAVTGAFSVVANAKKYAFMFDRSGSMNTKKTGSSPQITRFVSVVQQCMALLSSLDASTSFSVQSFDNSIYKYESANFIPNTASNRAGLQTWFNNHGPSGGTGLLGGIKALRTKESEADVLYLLLDGAASQEAEIRAQADAATKAINVIGVDLNVGSSPYNLLTYIADKSGGTKKFY
jgi:hypothetical protein